MSTRTDDVDDSAFGLAVCHGLDDRELADVFGISCADARFRRLRATTDPSLACLTAFRAAPDWLRDRTLDHLEL